MISFFGSRQAGDSPKGNVLTRMRAFVEGGKRSGPVEGRKLKVQLPVVEAAFLVAVHRLARKVRNGQILSSTGADAGDGETDVRKAQVIETIAAEHKCVVRQRGAGQVDNLESSPWSTVELSVAGNQRFDDIPADVGYPQLDMPHPVEIAARHVKYARHAVLNDELFEGTADVEGSLQGGPFSGSGLTAGPVIRFVNFGKPAGGGRIAN